MSRRMTPRMKEYGAIKPKPIANTDWKFFQVDDGWYRLFNHTLQFAPDHNGTPSLSERCDVDYYALDYEAADFCRAVAIELRGRQ